MIMISMRTEVTRTKMAKKDKRKWIDWDDECPECGDNIIVLTSAPQTEKPQCYDGDRWECLVEKHEGFMHVDEDGTAYLTCD